MFREGVFATCSSDIACWTGASKKPEPEPKLFMESSLFDEMFVGILLHLFAFVACAGQQSGGRHAPDLQLGAVSLGLKVSKRTLESSDRLKNFYNKL